MNLLQALSEQGEDNGSDFNDYLDGWLSWKVDFGYYGNTPKLTVKFAPYDYDKDCVGEAQTETYALVKVS